jgi:hypothetical protein
MRKKGENNVNFAGKPAIPPVETMISPWVSKVNPSHLAVVGYLEQATLGAWSFEGSEMVVRVKRRCFPC